MKLLNNLPITAKLGILVGVTLLGLCAAGLYSAYMMQQEMVSARVAQTHALVASAVAAEQVLDLVERGVGDFHFYTMNRADLVFAICHMIGIRSHEAEVAGSAAA